MGRRGYLWFWPRRSRSSTLPSERSTWFDSAPNGATRSEPMWMTSQRSGCPDHPAHRPAVARLTGFKRRVRTKSRSQLLAFQWIYERTGARRALFRVYEGSVPRRRTKRLFGDSRRQVFFGLTTLSPVGRTPGPKVQFILYTFSNNRNCFE
jgi:hypothetical protein